MLFRQKTVRRAAALLTAVAVVCTSAGLNVSAASLLKGKVTADALNVRKGPGKGNAIIDILYEGESVEISGDEKGWYKIRLGKKKFGWVSMDYIDTGKSKTTKTTTAAKSVKKEALSKTAAAEKVIGTLTVTGSYTNLRKGAGFGYAVITRVYCGAVGSILQKSGSWYKIKLSNSKTGWVNKKYVKVKGLKEKAVSASESDRIIVQVSSVNVRSKPSTSGKLVATIRYNEVYRYSEIADDWYKIITPSGDAGYVSGKFVGRFKKYAVDGGGNYIWPTQTATRLTTRFGKHGSRTHGGIDIAAPGGSQIIAVSDGKVIKKSYNPKGLGHLIVIENNDGVRAYYAHMKKESFLKKGDKVKAGDTIGIVGSTGKSTGNHLHLEFHKGDKKVDPLPYFPNIG